MNRHLVFVYGSLKTGHYNNRLLSGSARLLAPVQTSERYLLLDGEHFPFLVNPEHISIDLSDYLGHVRGEVYGVDSKTLAKLDRLESHPDFYRREEISVECPDGDRLAWCYFLRRYLDQPHRLPGPIMPDESHCVEWRATLTDIPVNVDEEE